jgi:hypothetical protein
MIDDDLIKKIKDNFSRDKAYWGNIYDAAKADMLFLSGDKGAQWESLKDIPDPAITLDVLSAVVNQVANDIRMNTPTVKVIAGDNDTSEETADILSGLIKNIEYESAADAVYDSSVLSAVRCGIGFFRVETEYEDDESFNQKLCIKRVVNPLNVYIDCRTVEADGSDMQHATIIQELLASDFKEQFPDNDVSSFTDDNQNKQYKDDESVFIAEHYYIESKTKTIKSPDGKKERNVTKKIVNRVLVSGNAILERTTFPGIYVPVIPVFGEEYWVNGKRYLNSAIRRSKDAQKMYNYWRSVETSLLSDQQTAPTMVVGGQIAGYEAGWKDKRSLVVEYRDKDDAGNALPMPTRLPPPQIPSGIVNAALSMANDIKATSGIYEASLGQRSNETSGVAIARRQQEGDVATFHFADNLTRAIAYAGKVMVFAIPEIYDTPRILNIMDVEDNVKKIGVNGDIAEDQEEPVDLTRGRYTVKVITGSSFTTKRQEAAEFFGKIVQSQPDLMQVMGDLLFKNMDLPGADALSERMKKVIDPKFLDEENDNPMAAQYQQQIQQLQQQLQMASQEMQAMQQQLENKQTETAIKVQSEQNKNEIEQTKLALQQSEMEVDAQYKQQELMLKMKELELREQELLLQYEEMKNQKELKEMELFFATLNQNPENNADMEDAMPSDENMTMDNPIIDENMVNYS